MSRDNEDFDVYDKTEELEEADEIDEAEAGFMKGYEDNIDETICSNCKQILEGINFIEEDIGGKGYRFCSRECADKFELKKEHL
tara:strand:- start:51 stop:302 length:252 start_codon:yes stop_codon:yes gene_type:complete